MASLVVMATAPAAVPMPLPNCTTLLVAPSPSGAPFVGSMRYPSYALPLPADPALCEQTFYFQSFHVERGGNFASSPMLSVRLQ